MAFNNSSKIEGGKIIILPPGCLGTTEIDLQCKSPTESVFYQFSMANRMASTDRIVCVVASPSSSDDTIVVDQTSVSGQTFKVRISGGIFNTKAGINFTVTTALTEVLTFVATLPICPSGIIGEGENGSYVIGNDGPQGEQGKAASIVVGKVIASEAGSQPSIVNTGTQYDAVFDFTLPRGEQGPQGVQGIQGEQGIQGIEGIQGIQGEAGTQILTSNRDPVRDDAGKNLVWLNTATGDLFETNPVGENLYAWDKIGNLKGEAGSVIYSGTSDPVYNEIYKTSDLYFNTTSSDLFSFNKAQWVKLSNLKGDQGLRGSLWFVGSEDPVASTHYKELDSYLNNNTYDLFVFNGNNWQKSGNLKGLQGAQGEKGDVGIQGLQGDQGLTGVAGKDGVDGERGSLWFVGSEDPVASTHYKELDSYLNNNTYDLFVFNGNNWQKSGNLKGLQGAQGEKGDVGIQGLQGDQGLTGVAGKDGVDGERGSLWFSGKGAPASSKNYKEFDCYRNELNDDIYVNNGSEWQLTGNIKGLQGEQGNQGEAGTDGKAGTIQIGNVSKGDNASITNRGNENAALLDFVLPKGDKGDAGSRWYSGTQEPNASTGIKDERGAPRFGDMYLQLATQEHEAKTYIKLNNGEWSEPLGTVAGPEGKPASITIGTITTGEPGTKVIVENVGTSSDVILNFTIPKGDKGEQGQAATITIGTITTGEPETDAIVTNVGDENNAHLNITIPKGQKGADGINPTLSIGTITTLDPDQQAKAEIIPGENGNNILNLGLVKGDKGQNGKNGQNGQDGKSYINDGSQVLNVRGLQIANIQSINVDDVPENTICLNEDSKQLVIRKNNSWKVLNMNNFEVETTYNNNNGVLPINFAIDNFTPSSNAKSTAEGLTTGYLSPDTSKSLLTPMNTLIRVDFKIASSDTTDSDYFIVGYENSLNIRINPGKKFVSVYSGNNKSYEMDYTAFGINLHDNKFHTAYFLLNCGYKGLTAYAIDGHYFNRSSAQTFLYMSSLRIRGTSTISVPENAMIVCNIGLSSILPSLKNNQAVSSDFTSFEGYYSCKNNSFTNQNSTNGILLKPFSNYDCFNSIQPYYIGDNQAFFNEDGCYKGSVAINAPYMFDSFTFECYFKYDSTYDTLYSMRRSIVGNMETYYSIGLQAGTVNKFTFKDYVAKTEITLVEELEKDKWHTLSISCFNKQAYIFIDGILTGVVPFAFYWNNIFLRACKSDNYVSPEKALYIKYVSFTIGEAKYFNHYDSSLTPTSPSNNNSYFYPLIDGRVANENTHSPLVQIDLNEGDSFDLHNVPLGETSGGFMNLIPIHYTYSNKPLVFNTKNTHIFIKNITGNPLKGTV